MINLIGLDLDDTNETTNQNTNQDTNENTKENKDKIEGAPAERRRTQEQMQAQRTNTVSVILIAVIMGLNVILASFADHTSFKKPMQRYTVEQKCLICCQNFLTSGFNCSPKLPTNCPNTSGVSMQQQRHHFLHSHSESEAGFGHQRCGDQGKFSTFNSVSSNQQCHDQSELKTFGIVFMSFQGLEGQCHGVGEGKCDAYVLMKIGTNEVEVTQG